MKYDIHDGEIMIHQRDSDVFLPLSLAEMQHVVDVMNALPDSERPYTRALRESMADTAAAGIAVQIVPTDMMQRAEALLDNENEAE